jgi:hypothetical protein
MADNTLKNSTYNEKSGRYVRGGSTEVSAKFVEWWDKLDVPKDTSDLLYVMEEKYVGRPDLLSYAFYGDVGLWWIICQYNGILDPLSELVAGKELLIPTQSKVDLYYKVDPSAVGGTPSTR